MAQFKYGSPEPKKVTVTSHDGRRIEVPEQLAKFYKDAEKPAPAPVKKES